MGRENGAAVGLVSSEHSARVSDSRVSWNLVRNILSIKPRSSDYDYSSGINVNYIHYRINPA